MPEIRERDFFFRVFGVVRGSIWMDNRRQEEGRARAGISRSNMTFEFQPNEKRKGRNKYVGSWSEPPCRLIPLPFTSHSLCQILNWGTQPDGAPYSHQEITHWCDRMHMQFLDTDEAPELEAAIRVAADVDCQWDLFLANTYTLNQLRELDFSVVRLPVDWFVDWLNQLNNLKH